MGDEPSSDYNHWFYDVLLLYLGERKHRATLLESNSTEAEVQHHLFKDELAAYYKPLSNQLHSSRVWVSAVNMRIVRFTSRKLLVQKMLSKTFDRYVTSAVLQVILSLTLSRSTITPWQRVTEHSMGKFEVSNPFWVLMFTHTIHLCTSRNVYKLLYMLKDKNTLLLLFKRKD